MRQWLVGLPLLLLVSGPTQAADPLSHWGLAEVSASHQALVDPDRLPAEPQHGADPFNLFVVVESGDQHVTILDGDRLAPITRFPIRSALHGGPRFSPDGRFVFFGSHDGWVTKYDLHSLTVVAEIRAGLDTRNIAVSSDGAWVAVGNALPRSVVILKARDLSPEHVIAVDDGKGISSRVGAVYDAPPRRSFIVTLQDLKEIWELSYDPDAAPIYGGFVHNFRKGEEEGIVVAEQPFGIRRIQLDDYLDDVSFDPYFAEVIGLARNTRNGRVVNLDARRKVADLALSGMPRPGSGITWQRDGRWVMAIPHREDPVVSVVDLERWETLDWIETLGPGRFISSHEATPYAWVDASLGPDRGAVQVINKASLEIVKTLRPDPGKTAAHVAFTRDGRYALLSIQDGDGAIVVYDADTLAEVKRIPLVKPSGIYNVFNEIKHFLGAVR